MIERNIRVANHGRYLTSENDSQSRILMGFHGYAESAEVEYDRLRSIEGSAQWRIVSVQGLHRFYRRRTNEVVSSWMTRQDRELAIADNAAYAAAVLQAVTGDPESRPNVVFSGFSQGVAMAYRSAVQTDHGTLGVISLAGDVPPELHPATLARIPRALLGRGDLDDWYTAEKLEADEKRLVEAGVEVRVVRFPGGHEWVEPFRLAAAEFLQVCLNSCLPDSQVENH
jgi:predicted esterase